MRHRQPCQRRQVQESVAKSNRNKAATMKAKSLLYAKRVQRQQAAQRALFFCHRASRTTAAAAADRPQGLNLPPVALPWRATMPQRVTAPESGNIAQHPLAKCDVIKICHVMCASTHKTYVARDVMHCAQVRTKLTSRKMR